MVLHIGGKTDVLLENIVSVHDYESFREANNNEVLKNEWHNGQVKLLTDDIKKVKSLIVTDEGMYLSGISVATLKKRSQARYIRYIRERE